MGSMEDTLKELLQHRKPKALQQYLRKVRAQAWEASCISQHGANSLWSSWFSEGLPVPVREEAGLGFLCSRPWL